MKKLLLLGLSVVMVGCSVAPEQLPTGVSTIPAGFGDATYLDKIDRSFALNKDVDFSKVKLCAAQSINNDGFTIKGDSKSYVGAFTGSLYTSKSKEEIDGGNIFKYIDEPSKTIIADGKVKTKQMMTDFVVKYGAKITLNKESVSLIFADLERAQVDTSIMNNKGFQKIGTWKGFNAQLYVNAIDTVAGNFKNCVNN